MMEEIKACPYCGSDQVEPMETWGKHYVTCACGATGPNAIGGKDDAVALWNAAVNQLAAKDAEIETLRTKVALYKDRAEESTKLWTENRSRLQDRIEELFAERDEARKVARRLYRENKMRDDDIIRLCEELDNTLIDFAKSKEIMWQRSHGQIINYVGGDE